MCVYPKNFQLFSIEKFQAYTELERLHTAFPDFPLTLCGLWSHRKVLARLSVGLPFILWGVLLHQAGVTPHRIAF